MPDKRATSMKLTKEVFDHLEEEQERRGLTTQQDTVESIIRDNMRDTDDGEGESGRSENPLAAAVWGQARSTFSLTLVSGSVLVALHAAPLVPGAGVGSLPVVAGLVGAVTVVLSLASAALALLSAALARLFADPEIAPNPRRAALATDGGKPADEEGND